MNQEEALELFNGIEVVGPFNRNGRSDIPLPQPEIGYPVEVALLMRRWWDFVLPTKPEKARGKYVQMVPHWRDRREPENFKQSYAKLQQIRGGLAVANSLPSFLEYLAFQPSVLVIFPFLFGEYSGEEHERFSQMFRDIRENSILTILPGILKTISSFPAKPEIILAMQELKQRRARSHEVYQESVERLVAQGVSKKYGKGITILENRDLGYIAEKVNGCLRL